MYTELICKGPESRNGFLKGQTKHGQKGGIFACFELFWLDGVISRHSKKFPKILLYGRF